MRVGKLSGALLMKDSSATAHFKYRKHFSFLISRRENKTPIMRSTTEREKGKPSFMRGERRERGRERGREIEKERGGEKEREEKRKNEKKKKKKKDGKDDI